MSFPRATGQIPVYYNHKGTGHGPMDSSYKDMPYSPLFPFGFGLSYTCFRNDGGYVVESGTFKAGVGGCSSIDLNLDFQWPFRSLPGND